MQTYKKIMQRRYNLKLYPNGIYRFLLLPLHKLRIRDYYICREERLFNGESGSNNHYAQVACGGRICRG